MKKYIVILIIMNVNLLFSQVIQEEFINPKDIREQSNELNYIELNSNDDSIADFVFDSTKVVKTEKDVKISGYRVQLISTKRIHKAEKVRDKAYDIFDYDIYTVFETPYYKVRVGDFVDFKECRRVEKIAKRNGFQNAWTVRSLVDKK